MLQVTKILWSPTSSIASPAAIIKRVSEHTLEQNSNAEIALNCKLQDIRQTQEMNEIDLLFNNSDKETIEAKYFVNATGKDF